MHCGGRQFLANDSLPPDLDALLSGGNLLKVVLEAVLDLDDPAQCLPFTDHPADHPHPQRLLALLAYCYASGLYDSEQIEQAALADPALRSLCGATYPTSQDLRQFRRQHRTVLRICLAKVLLETWRAQFWTRCADEMNIRRVDYLLAQAHSNRDLQSHFAKAAEERINCAVALDSMALDD